MAMQEVKSKAQIRHERKMYSDYWHCSSIDYVRYGLYEKQLTQEEILDFIPTFVFYNNYLKRMQQGVNESIYSNKLNLFYLFTQNHIPTPFVIAMVHRGAIISTKDEKMSLEELRNKMKPNKKYFFKPTDGAGGYGIKVLKSNESKETETFIKSLRKDVTYIVQEGIEQRNDLAQINPTSVNTLRIVTQYIGNLPQVCSCILRIGRNQSDVDNSAQGGMSCSIDIDAGRMNSYATAEHGGGVYYQHPDSHYVFEGKQIKDWETIKRTVLSYAYRFPELKNIGWDIALSSQGIIVIEMNLGYGIEHQQVVKGGMRRTLNVYPQK